MSGEGVESAPIPRVARLASEVYRAQFGVASDEPLAVAWAPGRINLIGEHTDYNEGYVLPAAINRQVALAGCPADEPFAILYSMRHRERVRAPLSADAWEGDSRDGGPGAGAVPLWARYVVAVWRQLTLLGAAPPARGFSAAIVGDVPLGGGLSSSAALEVASAMFVRALGGPTLHPMEMARVCQQAEQAGAGVQVGIMDQAASCLGRPRHAILLDCRTLDYTYIPTRMPDATWVVFDTRVPHTLATSEYNIRRGQCAAAVGRLATALEEQTPGRSVRTLRDITAPDLTRYGALLDETLARRARHVVSENERTLRAAEALRAGDVAAMGALLSASHASLRDDYAVSCRELDTAVDIAQTTPGVLGARMMGAGFGGSIIALTRRDVLPQLKERFSREYALRTGGRGAILTCAITGEMGLHQSFTGA